MRSHKLAATLHFLKKKATFRFTFVIVSAVLIAAQFMGSSSATRDNRDVREASIGSVAGLRTQVPTDVSRWLSRAGTTGLSFSPLAPPFVDETAVTYKADCTTAETRFSSGDVVCVKDTGYTARTRAIYWVNPDGAVVQTDPISSASDSSTRTVSAPGTWKIYLVGFDNEARDVAHFSVSDPARTTFDLIVYKNSSTSFAANGIITYQVLAQNTGPDDATDVVLTEVTPNNATAQSFSQDSGPLFTCTPGAGNTVCTIATLPSGASASFTFFYQLDGSPTGTAITSSVTIEDSTTGSATPSELHPEDNTWVTLDTIEGAVAPGTCSVGCPENVTKQADTTQGSQSGAIVHFSAPIGNGECGAITVDHCNDCFFPEGDTVVTASGTGDSCSFTVTVTPASGNATISCPGDHTADADANCEASIAIGTPTAAGDNVTVSGVRSDGKPLYNCDCYPTNPNDPNSGVECEITGACTRHADAPFSAGVTTILWTAYSHSAAGPYPDPETEEALRTGSASCVQTFTVNDVTPPAITASNTTASADANCQAPVPDYATIGLVTDNCACASSDMSQICDSRTDIIITQSVAAGTMVGLGPHTITLTANDGSSNNGGAGNTATFNVTFTVNDTTPPAFTFVPPTVVAYTGAGSTTCDAFISDATLGTATATDNCGSVTITRSPTGNTFGVGNTTVTWTATDGHSNSSTATQTVTVIDNTPPMISCPASITLESTCPSGARGTYTAPVGVDNCPSTTALTAGLASGSVFPIGTTTVTYTVTDQSGNSASCSFTVTVLTPQAVLQNLIAQVNASSLTGTQKNGLLSKLNAALSAINSGQTNVACNKLSEFVNSVQGLISHGDLTAAQGNAWILSANHVRNTIGCTNNGCS